MTNNNYSFTPKCKIIVDNVEYNGNVIKTFPKISHSNTSFVGGFPAKKLSFEIYDFDNIIDFENKEILVFKSLSNNDFIQQGVFIPKRENIKTDKNTKIISFSDVQDKTQLLDTMYHSELSWEENETHSGYEIINEICENLNIELFSDNFNWATYQFKQPNFPSGISNREVVSRFAEIGGAIAIFSADGKLKFKTQNRLLNEITNKNYSKLTYEKEQVINTVVLGKTGVNDDIVFPSEIETKRIECKILDNPFIDLYREEMIEQVAQYIIGISYTPYEVSNLLDDYNYELNDVLTIADRNNNSFNAIILDYKNQSRIFSDIKLNIQNNSVTNYNLAGGVGESLNQIKFDVDHIKNNVEIAVKEVRDMGDIVDIANSNATEAKQALNSVVNDISTLNGNYTLTQSQIASLIENANNLQIDITNTITLLNHINGNYATQNDLNNVVVNEVVTTTGYRFDKDGLNISKTGAPTSSLINEAGMSIKNSSNQEVFFAGYDSTLSDSVVKTNRMIMNNKCRFEDYTDQAGNQAIGCFWL